VDPEHPRLGDTSKPRRDHNPAVQSSMTRERTEQIEETRREHGQRWVPIDGAKLHPIIFRGVRCTVGNAAAAARARIRLQPPRFSTLTLTLPT
jgi:hypothetical protein